MIEWIRQAIFLTSSLIGANLIGFYYALSINIPFGVVAMLYAIIVRNSKNGSECAEVGLQIERANYLQLQIVCIILYIPMCLAPIYFFYAKGYGWMKEQYVEAQKAKNDD